MYETLSEQKKFVSFVVAHRCLVPECELSDTTIFHANWTKCAIPLKNGALDSCSRYAYISPTIDGICSEESFNRSQIISCDNYVTKNGEERLVNHVRRQLFASLHRQFC